MIGTSFQRPPIYKSEKTMEQKQKEADDIMRQYEEELLAKFRPKELNNEVATNLQPDSSNTGSSTLDSNRKQPLLGTNPFIKETLLRKANTIEVKDST